MDLLQDLSGLMRKPTFFICENKDADQRFCFRYTDSTIPLLSKSKISSLEPSSVADSSVCVRPVQKPCLWFSHEGWCNRQTEMDRQMDRQTNRNTDRHDFMKDISRISFKLHAACVFL